MLTNDVSVPQVAAETVLQVSFQCSSLPTHLLATFISQNSKDCHDSVPPGESSRFIFKHLGDSLNSEHLFILAPNQQGSRMRSRGWNGTNLSERLGALNYTQGSKQSPHCRTCTSKSKIEKFCPRNSLPTYFSSFFFHHNSSCANPILP